MSKKGNVRKTGRSDKAARHVRLYHWVLETAAWRSLMVTDRCLYLELLARYGGPQSNNGRIAYSVREAAQALHIGKTAAAAAFKRLEDRGFICAMQRGKFDRKVRHSTEWRLTEFSCDVTGELPTKDFVRWQPENSKPVSEAGPVGTQQRTPGPSESTVRSKIAAYGT